MKHTVFSLIAALAIVISICTNAPAEASAASRCSHDGETFTITADNFLCQYKETLKYNGCTYTMELAEDFSDSTAQYYDMYDPDGFYAMTLVLYSDPETTKLDTVRLFCSAEGISQAESDGRFPGMLAAYMAANPNMTDSKWEGMFTEDTLLRTSEGYGYSGAFDGISYSLWIGEDYIAFIIL